jgi:hypothetical protein
MTGVCDLVTGYGEDSANAVAESRSGERSKILSDSISTLEHAYLPEDLSEKVTVKGDALSFGGFCDVFVGELEKGTGIEKVAMKRIRAILVMNESQRADGLKVRNWVPFQPRLRGMPVAVIQKRSGTVVNLPTSIYSLILWDCN